MANNNVERSLCLGRSWDSALSPQSMTQYFKRWIEDTPLALPTPQVDGGAGWHIIDDRSTLGTDPYIVVSNHEWDNGLDGISNLPNRSDEPHKILKITTYNSLGGKLHIEPYLYWDVVNHVGNGRWFIGYVETRDGENFTYDFIGGDRRLYISTLLAGWNVVGLQDFDTDSRFKEGPDNTAVIQSGVGSGSNVVIPLADGEAANFTVGYCYFVMDVTQVIETTNNRRIKIDYAQVTARDTTPGSNSITVDRLKQAYNTGAIVTTYCHRYNFISNIESELIFPYLPYRSSGSYYPMSEETVSSRYCEGYYHCNSTLAHRCAPMDNGLHIFPNPVVATRKYLFGSSVYDNYGFPVDAYIGRYDGLTHMSSTLEIGGAGKDFIYLVPGIDVGSDSGLKLFIPYYNYV